MSPQARCRPSEASIAACGPCRAAPGLLEPARACGARETHPADGKRASSGACRVPVGAGPPLLEVGTAGNPRQPGGGGPGAGAPGRARTPGPASGRTQPERGGVARVLGGHPARGEGESGPDAAPPSEGLAAARGSGRGPPEVIQLEVGVQADPGHSSEWRLLGNLQIFSLVR